MIKKHAVLAFLLATVSVTTVAQSFYAVRRNRSLIVNAGTGTSTYFGELKNPGDYIDARPNLNVGIQYFVLNRISIRTELTWFQLSGDDGDADRKGRVTRNLSFVSNNYEVSASSALHLFPLGSRYYQRPQFNVYGFAGIGLLYFNPTAKLDDKRYALAPLQTEGVKYSRTQFVIPYGLGIKMKAGPFFNFAIEGGYRLTFTDYLDDVSTVHPDKSTWTDPIAIALSDRGPEIGVNPRPPGSIRGNPDANDGYFLMNLKIEYYLPTNFILGDPSKRMYNQKRRSIYRRR
jgi:hypothetical protein